MHLRISAILFYAILIGFATGSQNGGYSWSGGDDIDIDEVEGSGGDFRVFSGSGDRDSEEGDDEDRRTSTDAPPLTELTPNIAKKAENVPEVTDEVIMNRKPEDRSTSFFAQPGILAAVIGGAVVGLLCAILVVMFIVYRMRKKDEGSYALDEPKRSPTSNSFSRGNKEFYA